MTSHFADSEVMQPPDICQCRQKTIVSSISNSETDLAAGIDILKYI